MRIIKEVYMKPTQRLAEFIIETDFEDLPIEVVRGVKNAILDSLGCGIAGFALEAGSIEPVLRTVKALEGKKESTVIVDGFKTNFLHSALANGSFIHALDFDDTHQAALTHTSSVMVPAALALGEKLQASGKSIILAIALGYEAATKVGQSVMPSLVRYWHSTALNGTIGAAALGGKLLNLDSEKMNLTFGIASDIASGTLACVEFGDITKSLHAGMAAMKGLLAAYLVKEGATGPRDIFEFSKGYCNIYADVPKLDKITENIGNPFQITFNGVKGFPSILASHTSILAIIHIMSHANLKVEDIKEIFIKTYHLVESSFCNYNPRTLLAARLSVPFCVALAAMDGEVTINNFTEERINDPKIRALMSKITVKGDPKLDALYPEKFPAYVEITTKDGKKYSETEYYPKGSHKNPLTEEQFKRKFFSLATISLPEDQAILIADAIARLDELETISELTKLLVKKEGASEPKL
jgi:2-methylcitrate dehydratase PrpD